jgi:hypothetical protein
MHTITVVTEIDAPPDVVWDVLTDTEAFPRWNPFITSLTGELVVGGRLRVRIEPPGGTAMTFRPRMLVVEAARRLEWLGSAGVRGLVDGRHTLELAALPGGRTRFTHSERFSGVLVPFMKATLRRTEAGFSSMNDALRQRAEARVRSGS